MSLGLDLNTLTALAGAAGQDVEVGVRTTANPDGVFVRPGDYVERTSSGDPARPSLVNRLLQPEVVVRVGGREVVRVATSAGPPSFDLRPWLFLGALALGLGAVATAVLVARSLRRRRNVPRRARHARHARHLRRDALARFRRAP